MSVTDKSVRFLYPNDQEALRSSQAVRLYAVDYDIWKQNDVLLRWSGVAKLYVYLGDTCEFATTSTNKHVLFYRAIDPTIEPTCIITADTLRSFAERVGANGNLYLQFTPKGNGTLYLSQKPASNPPTDTDVAKTYMDLWGVCVADGIEIRVSKPQNLRLYNNQGALVRTWYQTSENAYILNNLPNGVYSLQGENNVIMIKY